MSRLLIISHTEHYKHPNGKIVGLNSTVNEINHLLDVFNEIKHIAMLHQGEPPLNTMAYEDNRITFVQIPNLGGKSLAKKIGLLRNAPSILKLIQKELKTSDYFQFRAPTGIGVYCIPFLISKSNKKGWFKYAGHWQSNSIPKAYLLQRFFLKNQNRIVTINGSFSKQKSNVLSFENPCLTLSEFEEGRIIRQNKKLNPMKIQLCFVGRVESEKGINELLKAMHITKLPKNVSIKAFHIVGSESKSQTYRKSYSASKIPFIFHGALNRLQVIDIYKKSHAIILPSKSEGFPKVVSEAINFGCLPIITHFEAVGNYITDGKNGFLIKKLNPKNLGEKILEFLNLKPEQYSKMLIEKEDIIERFTYKYYNKRIENEVLDL